MNKTLARVIIILVLIVTGLMFHFGVELGSMLWDNFTTKIEETM